MPRTRGNKEEERIYLAGVLDKEDYRGIKGSHEVNANSNSARPRVQCVCTRVLVRGWHIFVHVCSGFRCMRHICALCETPSRSMFQSLESALSFPPSLSSSLPSPRAHSFLPFYCSRSFYPFCLRAIKIYSVILRSATLYLNSFTLFPNIDRRVFLLGNIVIAKIKIAISFRDISKHTVK